MYFKHKRRSVSKETIPSVIGLNLSLSFHEFNQELKSKKEKNKKEEESVLFFSSPCDSIHVTRVFSARNFYVAKL